MNSNKRLIDWLFRFNVQLPSVGIEGLMAFMETRDPFAFFSPLFFDGLLVQLALEVSRQGLHLFHK
jgi:hypothetical protein